MEDGDLLSRALDFYGLPRKYDADLVRSRFRELSRKYHPDSGEFETDLLFKELVQLRDVLLASLEIRSEESFGSPNFREDKEGFQFYKEAKQRTADALEKYFQFTEGNPVFLKGEDNPALRILREELKSGASELKKFLERYPLSIWKDDAEKTLQKLSVWFKD